MSDQMEERIVVGIDFGTTYSGVAFAYKQAGTTLKNDGLTNTVQIIKTWPGERNHTSEKAPSVFVYNQFETLDKWGFQIKDGDMPLQCTKLLLDNNQKFPPWVNQLALTAKLIELNKTSTTVVADFLRAVHSYALGEIRSGVLESVAAQVPFQYVLTVPAVWSDTAKQKTLECAREAGLGSNVSLVSEPEAAAVSTFQSLKKRFRLGDVILICDAGGGTVDLTTYEVEKLTPLRFKEVVPGSGGLCGSAFINLGLENLLRKRVGSERFSTMVRKYPSAWAEAKQHFETNIKPKFEVGKRRSYPLPLRGVPDDAAAGILCDFIELSDDDLVSIFEPVVTDVIDLITAQIRAAVEKSKPPKKIVLVGGFGQSRYLYKRIKQHLDEAGLSEEQIAVLQPVMAWTAVVRGAVLYGLADAPMVTSRMARRHYGVRHGEWWDEEKHSWCNRYFDELSGVWYASNQMRWMIKKGDTVLANTPALYKLGQSRLTPGGSTHSTIYVCDENEPPQEYNCDGAGKVFSLGQVRVDLNPLPHDLWSHEVGQTGRHYRRISYELGMTTQSGQLEFDCRIQGEVKGSVKVKFD